MLPRIFSGYFLDPIAEYHVAIYERHQPEKTILYQTVARAWPKISLEYAVEGETIPRHVDAEFDRYQRCGILDYVFVRLYCKACDAERLVGFSCKGEFFLPELRGQKRENSAACGVVIVAAVLIWLAKLRAAAP